MQQFNLKEIVEKKGQTAIALALGVSVPAIHKAIKAKRQILVEMDKEGNMKAIETRPFPSQIRDKAA